MKNRTPVRGIALTLLLLLPGALASAQNAGELKEVLGIQFVWCPPGEFVRGNDDPAAVLAEQYGGEPEWYSDADPQCTIPINRGFWIGSFEVTVEQWNAHCEAELRLGVAQTDGGDNAKHPVTGMSFEKVRGFIDQLNSTGQGTFRLPTEDEWEYACRAGLQGAALPESNPATLSQVAWYADTARSSGVNAPMPVGMKAANAWGIFDMLGNVQEWCATPYGKYNCGRSDAIGDHVSSGLYVVRGGSYKSTRGFVRAASRLALEAKKTSRSVGFRLVLNQE